MNAAITASPQRLAALASALAFAAAATVLALFGMFALTGIGQDLLQVVSPASQYQAILLKDPAALKLVLGLDNLFIVFYAPTFLTIAAVLYGTPAASRVLLVAAVALLMLTGLLDLMENAHFRTMLNAAEVGTGITQAEIDLQVWASLVKFHVSYIGLFLLSFVLPAAGWVARLLRFLLRWVQAPLGILITVVPASLVPPLLIGRFAFFVVALLCLGVLFRRLSGRGERA